MDAKNLNLARRKSGKYNWQTWNPNAEYLLNDMVKSRTLRNYILRKSMTQIMVHKCFYAWIPFGFKLLVAYWLSAYFYKWTSHNTVYPLPRECLLVLRQNIYKKKCLSSIVWTTEESEVGKKKWAISRSPKICELLLIQGNLSKLTGLTEREVCSFIEIGLCVPTAVLSNQSGE